MKKSLWISAIVLFILLGTLSGSVHTEALFWDVLPEKQPLVVAHRGASSLAPENTLAAVYAALDLGVDLVEIDVHRSSDGELVVIHDDTVDRTTDGTGFVNRLTFNELRKLDAGSWFSPDFQAERIPTLREVLEVSRDKTTLLIELKGVRTEVRTVELVREMDMSDQVIIQSFDFQQIQKVKERAPEIHTIFLVSEPNHSSDAWRAAEWVTNIAQFVGASGIGIRHNWYTAELRATAAEHDLALFVWTVDDTRSMRRFLREGLHGIITNRPQDLLELLK